MGITETRRAWHAVAELLIAGPQFETQRDIRLMVTPLGFTGLTDTGVSVELDQLATPAGRFPITGSIAQLAAAAGIRPRNLTDVYRGGIVIGVADEIAADAASAEVLRAAFTAGNTALAAFAPDAERVLWPEHFDIGISVDEINYGVSPGDDHIGVPYAYVGPWDMSGIAPSDFWNMPFGAAVPVAELDGPTGIEQFFARGRYQAKSWS